MSLAQTSPAGAATPPSTEARGCVRGCEGCAWCGIYPSFTNFWCNNEIQHGNHPGRHSSMRNNREVWGHGSLAWTTGATGNTQPVILAPRVTRGDVFWGSSNDAIASRKETALSSVKQGILCHEPVVSLWLRGGCLPAPWAA